MAPHVKESGGKKKDLLCVFLSIIPVFGYFGFLFMGKKTGRKQFTTAGRIYGGLSLSAFAVLMLSQFLTWLRMDNFYLARLPEETIAQMQLIGIVALLVAWVVCFVHTLTQIGRYRQYLYLKKRSTPDRNPLVHDSRWRRSNLTWMFWSWLPWVGGLSLIFAGQRMQDKKAKSYGIAFLASALIISALRWSVNIFGLTDWRDNLLSIQLWLVWALWMATLLTTFMIREDYLDVWAEVWTRDTQRQPLLRDGKWCRENSRWRLWTYFPCVGGIGIILAGRKSGSRKHSLTGVILCVLSAIAQVAWVVAAERFYVYALLMILTFSCLLYAFTIFYGTLIRWEALKGRANSLQGYRSEFERELDVLERMQRRNMEVPDAPVRNAPEERKVEIPAAPAPVPAPAVKAPAAEPDTVVSPSVKIDINRCTQAELMQLPGVGISQAKHAMEHRAANNGFKSVDEFVEILQIKPHFAVKIFSQATVGEPAAPVAKPAADSSAVRRRIDF